MSGVKNDNYSAWKRMMERKKRRELEKETTLGAVVHNSIFKDSDNNHNILDTDDCLISPTSKQVAGVKRGGSQNSLQQAKKLKESEEISSDRYSEECQMKREAAKQKLHLLEKDIEEMLKMLENKKKQFDSIQGLLSSYSLSVEVKKGEYEGLQRGIEARIKELESKEKQFAARIEDIELKERQIEERLKKLNSKEEQFEVHLEEVESIRKKYESKLNELLLKEKQVEAQWKELEANTMQHEALFVRSFKQKKQQVANYTDNHSSTDGGSFPLFSSDPKDADILDILRSSSDPAKVILDIMKDSIDSNCKKGDQAMAIDDSHIFLLEHLMKISPHIKSHVREEAMELVLHMKANMRLSTDNSLVVLSFLMILSIYKLVSSFNEDEVLKLFEIVAHHKPAIELFRMLGFADKISDFVQNLIKNEQYIEAVGFIYAYDLPETNRAADLLQEHASKAKLCEMSCKEPMSNKSSKIRAAIHEITSLKTVVQCIPENQQCEQVVKEIQDRIVEAGKV
ncbi:hypothetical protein PIB30_025499 [Stylosanthes scabra]|uniref:FRIGIDA-like protein n=1 Tax=Stylosanthes scabra TaxID=79078 RepID=A0ABU6X988_9FABA|nr:hypothetical protein [Stylosanthes scabra]